MDEKNQQGLALGFKRARAKTLKIKELGIVPDMKEDAIDALITKLAKAKAKADEKTEADAWKGYLSGQRWYVEDLVAFSALKPKERLDSEYAQAFPDVADEDELLAELEALEA